MRVRKVKRWLSRGYLVLVGLVAVITVAVTGCPPARKPEVPQAPPRTLIVPEAVKISFDRVDPGTLPAEVKDVAKSLENRDAAVSLRVGNDLYLLISQGAATRDHKAELEELTQRTPRENFSWLEARVKYTPLPKGQAAPSGAVYTVYKVGNLARDINGTGFSFAAVAGLPPAPSGGTAGTGGALPQGGVSQQTQPGAGQKVVIDEPKANATVSSPLTVQGKAALSEGELRLRLMDNSGKTLVETPVNMNIPTRGLTAFTATLSFSTPTAPQPAVLEALNVLPGGEVRSLTKIPLTIR